MGEKEQTPREVVLEALDYCERIYRSGCKEPYLVVATILHELLDMMDTEHVPFKRIQAFAATLKAYTHYSFHGWFWAHYAMNDWITSLGYPPFWNEQRRNDFIWPDELIKRE